MTRKGFFAAAAAMAATLAASQGVLAQTPAQPTQPTPPTRTRPEIASARNMQRVRQMLGGLIGQLEHDQRDYGGWRVRAIASMRQAREDLDKALQWDATHPH